MYVLKRIFKMDFKNFFDKITLIHNETNNSKFVIFWDIVYSGIFLQAGYMDYYLLKMYNMTNKEKKTFLVRGKNNSLINKLNKKDDIYLLNNKIETNKLFNDYLKRDWLEVSDSNISLFLEKHPRFMAKPSNGQCGKGITIIDKKDYPNEDAIINYLKENNLDLLEEIVIQHQDVAAINNSSVNTTRIVTIFNQGKTFFVGACMRIGNNNYVDNFESGGMTARVDAETGLVIGPAIDKIGNIFYKHPVTNKDIVGFQIPYYEETKLMINEMANKILTLRYVGWDIAITDNGPVLIEANPLPGSQITQMPYPNCKKEGCLPKIKEALKYKKEVEK